MLNIPSSQSGLEEVLVVSASLELPLKYNLAGNPPHDVFQGEPQTPRTDDDAESGLIEPCFVGGETGGHS